VEEAARRGGGAEAAQGGAEFYETQKFVEVEHPRVPAEKPCRSGKINLVKATRVGVLSGYGCME
jgi:hypothetical protein